MDGPIHHRGWQWARRAGGVVTMNLEFIPMASREDSHLHSLHVPRFRHYAFRTDMHP